MSTKILIAAHELRGGTVDKTDGAKTSMTLAAGDELTEAKAKALGLDVATVAKLVATGALVEVSARIAEGEHDDVMADLREQLAEATQRAIVAETELADLREQLAEATQRAIVAETELAELKAKHAAKPKTAA